MKGFGYVLKSWDLQCSDYPPAQHTQYKIDNEKRSKDDERNKVNPGYLKADGIIHLCRETERLSRFKFGIKNKL